MQHFKRIIFSIITTCFLFANFAIARPIVHIINTEQVKLEQFRLEYYVDDSQSMDFADMTKQAFLPATNSLSLGSKSKTTWIKLNIKNSLNIPITLYMHHPYAYHNRSISLYQVVDNNLVQSSVLDMDDKTTQDYMFKGSAVFDFNLAPKQQKTLYVKSVSYSHQWFSLNIYDEQQSKRALLGQFSDIALLVGMVLALIIYNLLLYFSSRLKEHFFYACYLISGGFWIALSYGLLADLFSVYGSKTLIWHLSLVCMPIFLLLFMMSIFETRKKYPTEHIALSTVLLILIVDLVYGLFDITLALKLSSYLAIMMMLVSMAVTISILLKKHPIAPYFLLGHSLFVAFSAIAVLFYEGYIPFNYINSHGVGIGIMLEALVLSLIIAHRIRSLENIKAAQVDLERQANTDPLSQLYNRRYFEARADQILLEATQTQQPVSIAIFDIDHFKNINDTFGHANGDKVIKKVSDILKAKSRRQDIIARYGGEEFVILMPGTETDEAFNIADKIRQTVAAQSLKNESKRVIKITLSAGIAQVNMSQANPTIEDTINLADKALYQAKNSGRNQLKIYTKHPQKF